MIRIKLFVISAGAKPITANIKDNNYLCKFDEGYAQKFLKHLENNPGLCTACAENCISCRRKAVKDHSDKIVGHLKLPKLTEQFIDEPLDFLGNNFPTHDITIVINIHSDILLEIPKVAKKSGSKALIVPVENPDWLGAWTKTSLVEACRELELEFAAPKPFCSLRGSENSYINKFINEFGVGFPKLDIEISGGLIRKVKVITSAPCGATYYIARLIKDKKADESLIPLVCKGLSSYPCTASTKVDPEFKDSITHKANYIMIDIVKDILRKKSLVDIK